MSVSVLVPDVSSLLGSIFFCTSLRTEQNQMKQTERKKINNKMSYEICKKDILSERSLGRRARSERENGERETNLCACSVFSCLTCENQPNLSFTFNNTFSRNK